MGDETAESANILTCDIGKWNNTEFNLLMLIDNPYLSSISWSDA
jgi:hypothetical protein